LGAAANFFEKSKIMSDDKQSPFKLNPGRILILALGAFIVVIAISMWFGGIDSYNALREANTAATSGPVVEVPAEPTTPETPAQ
jgi:hypothetical protein